jgi:hypothetical protein
MKKVSVALFVLSILFLAGLPTVGWTAEGELSAVPTDFEVKAVFLYNFAKFIEWPADAFKNADTNFVIGVIGQDPFGNVLESRLEGKSVQGKALVFKKLVSPNQAADCQVLFVSSSEANDWFAIHKILDGSPVLTVSDIDAFVQQGGMVGFELEKKRVRFNINLTAAEKSSLKISSQLLKLAKRVHGTPRLESN